MFLTALSGPHVEEEESVKHLIIRSVNDKNSSSYWGTSSKSTGHLLFFVSGSLLLNVLAKRWGRKGGLPGIGLLSD